MNLRVLEHIVRRSGLAVRLSDIATGMPVCDGIAVTTWPSASPTLAVATHSVSVGGVAGFAHLPGLRSYEDGSTARDDWFASPVVFQPLPFVVRVEDATGDHLTVIREVLAPTPKPFNLVLPRSPSAMTPSGSMTVVANLVTEAGDRASWAVVELSVGPFVTGGVADARGAVVIPVPRAVAPTSTGTPAGGPVWRLTVRVRYRPADQVMAPGGLPDDPPTITSVLTQQGALINDRGSLAASLQRDLTTGGALVLTSHPAPAPSVLVVRPAP